MFIVPEFYDWSRWRSTRPLFLVYAWMRLGTGSSRLRVGTTEVAGIFVF
jgi:hypothetical protein